MGRRRAFGHPNREERNVWTLIGVQGHDDKSVIDHRHYNPVISKGRREKGNRKGSGRGRGWDDGCDCETLRVLRRERGVTGNSLGLRYGTHGTL